MISLSFFISGQAARSPVDRGVLKQNLVVPAEGDDKDDGLHVVETVDPLAPLTPLAPNIHNAKFVLPVGDASHHSVRNGRARREGLGGGLGGGALDIHSWP